MEWCPEKAEGITKLIYENTDGLQKIKDLAGPSEDDSDRDSVAVDAGHTRD